MRHFAPTSKTIPLLRQLPDVYLLASTIHSMSGRWTIVHPFSCPACNSKNVRTSLAKGFWEPTKKLFGFQPARCRDCDERWTQPIWDLLNAIYARCPCCYGLELSFWAPGYYRSPFTWKLMMLFGAKPRRCEFCRKNFVSFRPCKIRYLRRRPKSGVVAGGSIPG